MNWEERNGRTAKKRTVTGSLIKNKGLNWVAENGNGDKH